MVKPTPAVSWYKWPFSGLQNPRDKKTSYVHEERPIPSPCFCGRSRTGQQPCSAFFSPELALKATRDRLKDKSDATAPSPSTRKEASNAYLVGSTRREFRCGIQLDMHPLHIRTSCTSGECQHPRDNNDTPCPKHPTTELQRHWGENT